MIRVFVPFLGKNVSRSALGVALAAAVATVGMSSPAMAQKRDKAAQQESVSPAFGQIAAPFQKTLEEAKARPDVVAAKNNPAALSAALANEKTQYEQVLAAATTPYDRFAAGGLGLTLGQLANDPAILKRGLSTMIESGRVPPEQVGQLQFFLGQTSLQLKDYAGAQTALQAAISAGYRDNDIEATLAQAYISDNKPAQGLAALRQAIEARQATGAAAPENWYRVGLGAAFRAKQLDQASFFSTGLARHYPTKQNWGAAITVVRDVVRYQDQENLDLLRLMARTDSYAEARDYREYIEVADARRFPGEVLKVIESGIASGKLKATDPGVPEARTTASGRITADRASLPAMERDARAPSATITTVSAAADTYLSYGDAAKAEDLYKLALAKPGGDAARLNTRLGIAQIDKGDYAAAQATFAKVQGPRQPLAQLWSVYAAQKAAGK
jgi:hypothetical protein